MAIKDTIKKIGSKVVDVASDVIADNFMGARANRAKAAKSNALASDMQMVKKAKGAQDGGDYRDPLFRARANVSNYETEYAMRMSGKPTR